ncbi:MAG: hypothetical protein GTN89_12625 [Acidobacteria bacterium]|nr:hypothetical protein [Acidobacteriota bacterium]NIM63727.1 hypothetical protein [Acidobacteriota bacterium]NIO60112.1 hypothetical protein [Acidobacteriota bacterium]NIQ31183.1 hypothetical protein [Acidobacteriota bacterium]NIQ86312.1 hypothetical protein [Acidobacteriota bacterium]
MSRAARAGFVLLLFIGLAVPLGAQDNAADWLKKMAERAAAGHYKFRFNADVAMTQEGVQGGVKIDGSMNYVTAKRFRAGFNVDMDMGGMAMAMAMKTVSDGTTFWIEIDSPMLGGKQVMSGTTEQFEKLAEMSGADLSGLGGMGQDPIEQISALVEAFDLTVQGVEDGRVTLHATITPEQLAASAQMAALGEAIDSLTLVLDAKDGLPIRLTVAGEQPIMTIDFVDYEFFGADEVRDTDYTYTPPEGVTVTDIGSMLGS